VRGRGRPSESKPKPAISGAEVSADSSPATPATGAEVSTDSGAIPHPGRAPSASACEPYRELIADALARGRNAMALWQDLVLIVPSICRVVQTGSEGRIAARAMACKTARATTTAAFLGMLAM
jgi:hypothetical protein